MRILAICPHFRPDTAPTGTVMSRITDELLAAGADVDIVTTLPWYTDHAVEPEWKGKLVRREVDGPLSITRMHPFPADKGNLVGRALSFGAFTTEAAAWAVTKGGRPDVVFAMSPPLTLGLAGAMAAKRWRVPFVFNIQDVFPDAAVASGAISGEKVIAAFSKLELMCYRSADAVTVLSDDLADNVNNKLDAKPDAKRRPRVEVIPNFADTAAINPMPRETAYRSEFGLGDKTVVMYAGNVGWSQPLHLLVDAAKAHADNDNVVFVVNGNGSALDDLKAKAAGLDNIVFVDFQPMERLSEVLASGDIHIVALQPGLAAASVPSKMYSILAASRPVLASVDPGTEVANVIAETGAGLAVDSSNEQAFHDGLAHLLNQEESLENMGEKGRAFVETWLSPESVAKRYLSLFAQLMADHRK